MTRLVIVRHGNTFEAGAPPLRIGSRTDLPLTTTGVAQAEALGRHFADAGVRFERALSSNLQRTRRSAEAILAAQPDPPAIETTDWLGEIDHGPDEGQPETAVVSRIGNAAITAWDTELMPPPGWEVRAEWRLEAWRAFGREVIGQLPQGTVLLVTSNGAARFALAAFGLRSQAGGDWTKLRTGSYGLIELDGTRARLIGWNRKPDGGPGDSGLF